MFDKTKSRGLREAGWGWTAFAGGVGFLYFLPVFWIVLTAFKTHQDALATPPRYDASLDTTHRSTPVAVV